MTVSTDAERVLRWLLLAAAMGCLLIPRAGVSAIAAMILAVPVAITGVRDAGAFRWWAVYAIGFTLFAKLRDVADLLLAPFVHYPIVVSRVLGLGELPVVRAQQLYTPGSPTWYDYAAVGVYLTHFVAFPVVGLIVWRKRPDALRPYLVGFTLALALSVLVHALVPTVPPWMAAQMGHLPTIYKPVEDLLGGAVPGVYSYGLQVAGGNSVAAMPSVHSSAALFIALAALDTRWAWLGIGYAALMGLSLVYLGEHYVVDVMAGWLVAWFCWRRTGGLAPPSPGREREGVGTELRRVAQV